MTREQRTLYKDVFAGMSSEEIVEQLEEWHADGGCEAACPHRCWVEADGDCEHGHPSWLKALGWI
jgi:hypothetical protein